MLVRKFYDICDRGVDLACSLYKHQQHNGYIKLEAVSIYTQHVHLRVRPRENHAKSPNSDKAYLMDFAQILHEGSIT